jgi:glycosyltransferase involved in cell wall biosynthesis
MPQLDGPLISIVTATYRDPTGLRRTADSLRKLTSARFTWEHVIVDSSPDENVKVLDSLGSEWPLVHVVEPPRGIYAALNSGVTRAHGKYLWFLNGGDCLTSPDCLERILERLEHQPAVDLLACSVERVREGRYQFCATPHDSFVLSILGGSTCLIHQGVIYRRAAFDRAGPFDLRYRVAADHHHYWRCYIEHLGLATTRLRLATFDVSGTSEVEFHAGFRELRQAHRELAPRLPPTIRLLNFWFFYYVYFRTAVLKAIQKSKYAGWARPVWLAWKRRCDQ